MEEDTKNKSEKSNEFTSHIARIVNQVNMPSTAVMAAAARNIGVTLSAFQETRRLLGDYYFSKIANLLANVGSNIQNMVPDISNTLKSFNTSTIPYLSIFEDIAQSTKIFPEFSKVEIPKQETEEILDLDQLENDLDFLISEVNPEYVKLRTGAWEALESDNVDKIRHASVSMRELIKNIIGEILPSGKPRREGLKEALPYLKENELKFVDNTIELILCLDRGVHRVSSLDEKFAKYVLSVGEKTLWLILRSRK